MRQVTASHKIKNKVVHGHFQLVMRSEARTSSPQSILFPTSVWTVVSSHTESWLTWPFFSFFLPRKGKLWEGILLLSLLFMEFKKWRSEQLCWYTCDLHVFTGSAWPFCWLQCRPAFHPHFLCGLPLSSTSWIFIRMVLDGSINQIWCQMTNTLLEWGGIVLNTPTHLFMLIRLPVSVTPNSKRTA